MLIFVELPEAEETFQFDLEDSATIAQLKSELEEETSFSPERQNLYFVGIFLDSNFDNVCLNELLEPFSNLNMDLEFVLYLPKASDNTVDKKWLVLGINFKSSLNNIAYFSNWSIWGSPTDIWKSTYFLTYLSRSIILSRHLFILTSCLLTKRRIDCFDFLVLNHTKLNSLQKKKEKFYIKKYAKHCFISSRLFIILTIAWPHFWRTQLHSPPNGDFCPRIWAS